MATREFFPKVRRTIMQRPIEHKRTDILGQKGSVLASQATIFGDNWYHDTKEDLIEIWDAGPALVFRDILPQKDKYVREGLYLKLSIAYRTTKNAMANIRSFSGNHVNLPNAVDGGMYEDTNTVYWVTDDMTLNVNSIYSGEKLWLQRVDWEWVSRDVIYYDELVKKGPYLIRTREEVDALYIEQDITPETVKEKLIERIRHDEHFAKRCLAMLGSDKLLGRDLVDLYQHVSGE